MTDPALTFGFARGDLVEVRDPKATFTGVITLITRLLDGQIVAQVGDDLAGTSAYVVYLPTDRMHKVAGPTAGPSQ